MERERCENCNAPVFNLNVDELFKRCSYCGSALEKNDINVMTNIITIEDIYYI